MFHTARITRALDNYDVQNRCRTYLLHFVSPSSNSKRNLRPCLPLVARFTLTIRTLHNSTTPSCAGQFTCKEAPTTRPSSSGVAVPALLEPQLAEGTAAARACDGEASAADGMGADAPDVAGAASPSFRAYSARLFLCKPNVSSGCTVSPTFVPNRLL
jgi:hypothetical protein